MNEDNERRAFEEAWNRGVCALTPTKWSRDKSFAYAGWLARARINAPKGEPVQWKLETRNGTWVQSYDNADLAESARAHHDDICRQSGPHRVIPLYAAPVSPAPNFPATGNAPTKETPHSPERAFLRALARRVMYEIRHEEYEMAARAYLDATKE